MPPAPRRAASQPAVRRSAGTPGSPLGRILQMLRFDPSPRHRQPAAAAVVLATVVSIVGSLAVDWVLARLGVAVFPSTKGYPHFQFADYAKLTVVGIVGACVAWPIVTRLCAAPRWLFARLAVAVTLVLLLPDLAILVQGQPAKAVLVLVLMHLGIGIITYNALVHLAPTR